MDVFLWYTRLWHLEAHSLLQFEQDAGRGYDFLTGWFFSGVGLASGVGCIFDPSHVVYFDRGTQFTCGISFGGDEICGGIGLNVHLNCRRINRDVARIQ